MAIIVLTEANPGAGDATQLEGEKERAPYGYGVSDVKPSNGFQRYGYRAHQVGNTEAGISDDPLSRANMQYGF